jgi:integrase
MTARHGFRVSELCELRWDQIDLRAGLIHVTRKKNGVPSTHPLNRAGHYRRRPMRRRSSRISIVGTDRTPDNGYFRAKVAQEKLIEASGIPYSKGCNATPGRV